MYNNVHVSLYNNKTSKAGTTGPHCTVPALPGVPEFIVLFFFIEIKTTAPDRFLDRNTNSQ